LLAIKFENLCAGAHLSPGWRASISYGLRFLMPFEEMHTLIIASAKFQTAF